MKLEDADAVAAEIADAVYEKAIEVVTDTVQAETVKSDLAVIGDYQKWVTSPERGTPEKTRSVIGKALDAVKTRINKAAAGILEKVRARLHEPAVMAANTDEIRKTAKESLLKKLKENQDMIRKNEASASPAKDRKRKQNIEH